MDIKGMGAMQVFNLKLAKLKAVYETHKHLDALLSDKEGLSEDFRDHMLYEFWQAIKAAMGVEQEDVT